ncbi:MAG TPA: SMP-30/gluconolactonase/LRE family protein, partial [Limnochordia bacterium]|nr:SMP-30/gluconolactonase/LRE family protein [Limnochordia bacterium]
MSQPSPVTSVQSLLGEGAIWYRSALYWVDILGKRVHRYDPATGEHREYVTPETVGTVVPRATGGLVVALQHGFAHLDEESGEVTPLGEPVDPRPETRFNDGKCDPAGRLWAGTMGFNSEPGMGSLYMLDVDGRVEEKIPGVTTSNGICWNRDATEMYYIDTPTHEVWAFDYDVKTGAIGNRRVAVKIDPAEGAPDGMT